MNAFELQKQQIVDTAQALVWKGYLMATGGNLSLRIPGQDAFAITPSNYDYMKMSAGDVCVLDFSLTERPPRGACEPLERVIGHPRAQA